MTAEQFIARLGTPQYLFADTLAFIDAHYQHQPLIMARYTTAPSRIRARARCWQCRWTWG